MLLDSRTLPMPSRDADFIEEATGTRKKRKPAMEMTDKEKKHRATVGEALRILDAMRKEQRRPMRGLLQKSVHRRKMRLAPLRKKKQMPGKPMPREGMEPY